MKIKVSIYGGLTIYHTFTLGKIGLFYIKEKFRYFKWLFLEPTHPAYNLQSSLITLSHMFAGSMNLVQSCSTNISENERWHFE